MKICILSASNIKHMSLISLYTSQLEKYKIPYDIIYFDKYGIDEKINAQSKYKLYFQVNREWSLLKKLNQYLRFRKTAKKIIKKNNYDFLIVWGTHTTFLFADYLFIHYRKRYCLNIRDYFHEKRKLFYLVHKIMITNSSFSTISSLGFLKFLPKFDYKVVHSLNDNLKKMKEKSGIATIDNYSPIIITFIGYVRFFDTDKKLIDELGNDQRFILKFIGEGAQYLQPYVDKQQIKNVVCIAGFNIDETVELLNDANIINNLYGKNNIALDTAISIKFYYSIMKKIPILTFRDTYISELSRQLGIGISIDEIEGSADDIFNQYNRLLESDLSIISENFLEKVEMENQMFSDFIINKFMRE
ncbi:hypothetical protein ACODG4_08705 [Vagococcus fluvialis]|uniref:hypothetical protein n=1 Tax=Vagococcus fluvialis TaxID=2738 RepID=UPI003B59CF6C